MRPFVFANWVNFDVILVTNCVNNKVNNFLRWLGTPAKNPADCASIVYKFIFRIRKFHFIPKHREFSLRIGGSSLYRIARKINHIIRVSVARDYSSIVSAFSRGTRALQKTPFSNSYFGLGEVLCDDKVRLPCNFILGNSRGFQPLKLFLFPFCVGLLLTITYA